MTQDEEHALFWIDRAKQALKNSFSLIDPAPKDPAAAAILEAMDKVDVARKEIGKRGRDLDLEKTA